jgi:hypothetical protein
MSKNKKKSYQRCCCPKWTGWPDDRCARPLEDLAVTARVDQWQVLACGKAMGLSVVDSGSWRAMAAAGALIAQGDAAHFMIEPRSTNNHSGK